MSVFMSAQRRRPHPALAAAAIAGGVTLLVCLPSAPGVFGALGLLLAAGTAVVVGSACWVALPPLMVAVLPTLIPSPIFLYTFAWELAVIVLLAMLILHGWRERSVWLTQLGPIERALWLFTAWALFTGFWCEDLKYYLLGVRRLLLGACTLWIALRLPHVASRRWFDLGVIGAASALSLAAILHALTTGFSAEQALMHRSQVTHLGWGTANFVASLLLLCAPSLLHMVLKSQRLERWLASAGFGLVTAVQFIVASRAATVLFMVGSLIQLLRINRRFRWWASIGFVGAVAGLFASPAGTGLLSRLDNIRELGSMTIRIWYFREGWRRLLEHQPFGMGLGQGYVHADHLHGIDPHDYWLLLGGDLGVVGVVLWAAVLVALVRALIALRRHEQVHAILLTLVVANLHTLVEPTFQGAQYQLLFFWVVGGALAYAAAEAAAPRPEPLREGRPGPFTRARPGEDPVPSGS